MVRRATGSSPTDGQIPRTDTGGLTSLAQRFALKDQRNRPVFISSLTYTRARGARRRRGARLADGRISGLVHYSLLCSGEYIYSVTELRI